MSKNEKIIFGVRPVEELLKSKLKIKKIWIETGKTEQKFQTLTQTCSENSIPFGEKSYKFLSKLSQTDKHQSIVAIYTPLEREICFENKNNKPRNKHFLCVYLDRIQDPQNLGAIARSCEFFEVDQIFYPEFHGAPFNSIAFKTSSGAGIHNPPYKIKSVSNLFEKFKKHNFEVIGTSTQKGIPIKDIKTDSNMVLVIGSEHSGISEKISKYCTQFVNLPQKGKVESLNASVSAGIFLYQLQLNFSN